MAVMAGDLDFSAFYRTHFDDTARRLRPLAGDAAEDVVQEAFVALLERWHEVRRYDAPIAWVRLVATRIAMRRVQRDLKRIALQEKIGIGTGERPSDPDLREAISALPSGQAAAIAMHHLDDRPVAEVAQAIGCSVPTAKVWLHRGRARLAERVGGYRGRWVSEVRWSVDDIVGHLAAVGATEHVAVVLDDLQARGGRWELTLADARYVLERDDGLALDHGRFVVRGRDLVLAPGPSRGRVVLHTALDGERMRLNPLENTTPPTKDVPDEVWLGIFLGSAPFEWAGRPSATV